MDATRDQLAETGGAQWYDLLNGDITELGRVYFQLEQEPRSPFKKIYWDSTIEKPTLFEFVGFYAAESRTRLYRVNTKDGPVALVFVSDYIPEERANVGILYFRKYWGKDNLPISRQILGDMHAGLGVKRVFGMTPWPLATSHARASGMKRCGLIKKYANGKDVHVLVSEQR